MDWILPAIAEADILLLGTPIYGRNMTHYLMRLLERTFSFSLPEMQVRDGETSHPGRIRKFPRMVLASTCGFPDASNFAIVRAMNPTAVHILLPASQMLFSEDGKAYLSDFLEAIKLAGEKMANGEEISESLRNKLIVEFSDEMKQSIIQSHNEFSASQME
jgi:multimeric flavodoxin WrbA